MSALLRAIRCRRQRRARIRAAAQVRPAWWTTPADEPTTEGWNR